MKTALVCIAKNEDKYLNEWLDYHFKLGFDDIYVFENNWEFVPTVNKGEYIERLCVVKVVGEVMQLPVYNYFIEQKRNDYDWVAFFDVDEFLVLKKHRKVNDWLSDPKYADYNSISVNWFMFGDGGQKKTYDDYDVINRFLYRQKDVNRHTKVIINLKKAPADIKMTNPHCSNYSSRDTNGKEFSGPFNPDGPTDVVQLNHYFTKTLEEFEEKINRGRADVDFKRPISEFYENNFNDVRDEYAWYYYNDMQISID